MGKELTIIALAGTLIFGFMYFTKQFCKGEEGGAGGMTGPAGFIVL